MCARVAVRLYLFLLLVRYLCTKYLFEFAIFILSHYEHMYLN